jgi:predicted secreted hydrolase
VKRLLLLGALLVLSAAAPSPPDSAVPFASQYRPALPGWKYEFPRDHASHPEFQTEWWYYTGHLEAKGRAFGYQVTFFRVGLDPARANSTSAWAPHTVFFAHGALTDVSRDRYLHDQRVSRPALGLAGADTAQYRAWIGDWSADLAADGRTHRLRVPAGDFMLELDLDPAKPAVIQGREGISRKSAGVGRASHYYSFTRMATRGRVASGADTMEVTGLSWMDHEFGSSQLAREQVGWDWFSLQLDDGRELMLYRLRLKNGTDEPFSSGTVIARDGRARHLELKDFKVTGEQPWLSPHTGGRYPMRWRVSVPSEGMDLTLEARVRDQEMVAPPPVPLAYWEGAVTVRGSSRAGPVTGLGYVEMTGYAGALPGF